MLLLDTCVLSELRKPDYSASVREWIESPPGPLYVSEVSLAEIRFGIETVKDQAFKNRLYDWLNLDVRPWFEDRILPVSEEVILRWRHIVSCGRRANHTFSQPDLFIAATASVQSLTILTRNLRDFERAGVNVIDPWESAHYLSEIDGRQIHTNAWWLGDTLPMAVRI